MWFAMVWWWFLANMAGQRNKNAFKSLLQLLILSQNIFWVLRKWFGMVKRWFGGGFGVVWVFPRTLTDRIISPKKYFLSRLIFLL